MSLQQDSYVTFMPNTKVNFIKVSSFEDGESASFSQALKEREQLSGDDILLTQFKEQIVGARYFPPSSSDKNAKITYTVFRKSPDQNYYEYVYTLKDGKYILQDYNIKSDHFYHYLMSVEDQTINKATGEKIITYDFYENTDENANLNYYRSVFSNWTICDIEETTEENVYTKVGNIWKLGLNMEGESVTKNLNISSFDTLGKYPKIFMGKRNYDSMTFTGLLGNIYEYTDYNFTGESNAETTQGVSKYGYTERQDSSNSSNTFGIYDSYSIESQKLESWKEFITNGSLKLIRDLKGNAWIVQIAESTSYDINNASNLKQTSISFTWKQVKDLSGISIVVEG